MQKNSVFIGGVLLMVLSASVFSQPTSAVAPSSAVVPATSGREPATATVSSKGSVDSSAVVPISSGDGVTGGQLEVLQGKTQLLEARVQAARLQKELTSALAPADVGNVPATGPFAMGMPVDMGAAPVPTAPAATRASGRITILEVSGRGNALQATLSFPDGRQSLVQTGSLVAGTSLKVKAITLSSVTLSDGQQLTF